MIPAQTHRERHGGSMVESPPRDNRKEVEMIDQEVIDQAEEIRQAGPVNMMDRVGVQQEAHERGSYSLVVWIEDNRGDYLSLLSELGR